MHRRPTLRRRLRARHRQHCARADSVNPPGAPPGTIARVTGYDISVDGGNSAPLDAVFNAPSVYVSSGSVVTVHSGDAHMVLTGGGQVDICGPAKFTMLVSGGAITLALNFGRVHATLPATSQVRIFTPTIVATPIDISGNQRDITAGLDLNDSLCVRATSGALKLEQQFTGEDLIVPQSGEFFLADGKLLPVAGKPGSCDCVTTLHAKNVAPPLPNIPLLGLGGKMPAPAPAAPEVAAENPSAPPPQICRSCNRTSLCTPLTLIMMRTPSHLRRSPLSRRSRSPLPKWRTIKSSRRR